MDLSRFFSHFLDYLVSTLFCIGLGASLLWFVSNRIQIQGFFSWLFAAGVLGLTVSIVAYAEYMSAGITIMGAFIILLFFFAQSIYSTIPLQGRRTFLPEDPRRLVKLSLALLLSLIIFSWEGGALLPFQSKIPYHALTFDTYFYGYITQGLKTHGQENIYHVGNIFNTIYRGVTPYHYYELWAGALFSKCWQVPAVVGLYTGAYALMSLFAVLGVWAFIEKYKLALISVVPLTFFLFSGGIYSPAFDTIGLLAEVNVFAEQDSVLSYPNGKKLLPLFMFVCAGGLCFPSIRAYYLFLAAGVASVAILPGLVGGMGIFLLFLYWRRQVQAGQLLCVTAVTALVGGYFILLYKMNAPTVPPPEMPIFADFSIQSFKTIRNIIAKTTIQFIIFQIVNISLLIWIAAKKPKHLYGLLGLWIAVYGISLLCWAVLYPTIDAVQLFYIPTLVLMNVIVINYISLNYPKLKFNVFFYGFVLFWGINTYLSWQILLNKNEPQKNEPAYNSAVFSARLGNVRTPGPNGVCFVKYADDVFTCKTFLSLPGTYLSLLPQEFYPPVQLSVFDIPTDNPKNLAQRNNSIFYHYCERLKANGRYTTLENAQLSFVIENKIGYAITQQGLTLPPRLRPYVHAQYDDPQTGDTFYVFQPWTN